LKKSSLVRILSSFTPDEIKDFADYLSSPFFNKNKGVIKLYTYLKKQYPAFKEDSTAKEFVWSVLFPGAVYNDGLLRIQMFTITNLAMDFLLYKELKKNRFMNGNHLLHALNERNLLKQFEKARRHLNDEISTGSEQSELYTYNRYVYEYENVFYQHKLYYSWDEKKIDIKGVRNIAHYATLFHVIVMLKTYLYFLNTKQLYETNADTGEFEDFIKHLSIQKYPSTPIVSLLYHTIKLHTDEDNEKHFIDIRDTLLKHFDEFHLFDSIEILINMENYCKRMMRKGKSEYLAHLFSTFCFELENQTYKIEHNLSERMYISITETALALGKIEWAESFIEDYKAELLESVREISYKFAKALCEFTKKNFPATVDILINSGYTDAYNKFRVKNLLIAAYYELDRFDKMEAVIDSYRHLLTDEKYISAERKKNYMNFISSARKLIRLKTKFDPFAASKLREMLMQPDFVIDPKWLLSKIDETEAKNAAKR
jgi:hypothetical protein